MSAILGTFCSIKTGIYQIKNLLNGKVYIGSAINIPQRWRQHKSALNLGYHDNPILQKSWVKNGCDAFEFSIIECFEDKSLLASREQFWMDSLNACDRNTGYNICRVIGSRRGVKLSDETKAKISAAKKGTKFSDEIKQRMSAARIGIKRSDATKQRMSDSQKGKTFSAEHRANMAKARLGVKRAPHTEETKRKISEAQKGRPVTAEKRAMISAALTGSRWSPARRKAYEDSL